jgi:hypothetical protein
MCVIYLYCAAEKLYLLPGPRAALFVSKPCLDLTVGKISQKACFALSLLSWAWDPPRIFFHSLPPVALGVLPSLAP